jgi:hypothetical protein
VKALPHRRAWREAAGLRRTEKSELHGRPIT